jgi:hypothetical protein
VKLVYDDSMSSEDLRRQYMREQRADSPFQWPAWVCWILEQAHPRYWYALAAAAILLAIVR